MPQKDIISVVGRTWDFLEPAMNPDLARTFHAKLLKPVSGSMIYRHGQVIRQKTDGTNEWAKNGTSGYAGPPAIIKYSVIVDPLGRFQYSNEEMFNSDVAFDEGTVGVYYKGYFKTQDLVSGGGTSEVQTETIAAGTDGGTRILVFGGYQTAPIAWNANAAAIQAALELLPNVVSGDITVAGSGPYTYTFAGNYAGGAVPLLEVISSLNDGGVPTGSTIVRTTPGVPAIAGIGRLVRGTAAAGILDLGVGAPA